MAQSAEGFLKDVISKLQRMEDLLLGLLLAIMIVLACSQILLRNLFDSGLSWVDPGLRIGVLWVTMLGAMVATREKHHIHIDLLSRFLPLRYQRYNLVLTDSFAAFICAMLTWHSFRFVYYEWQDGVTLFASVPAWLAESALPLGFAIMTLRFIARAVSAMRRQEIE